MDFSNNNFTAFLSPAVQISKILIWRHWLKYLKFYLHDFLPYAMV